MLHTGVRAFLVPIRAVERAVLARRPRVRRCSRRWTASSGRMGVGSSGGQDVAMNEEGEEGVGGRRRKRRRRSKERRRGE